MSLNNIALPLPLVAELYHQVLVQGSARPVPIQQPVSFLGKNTRRILVVVNEPGVPHLADGELQFLTNVLSACNLGLGDVAIVNSAAAANGEAGPVLAQLSPETVLLFGLTPAWLGAPEALPYTPAQHEGRSIMAAPPLSAIETDKEAKKKLWISLKQLFCI